MSEKRLIISDNHILSRYLVPCLERRGIQCEVVKDTSIFLNKEPFVVLQEGRGEHVWKSKDVISPEFSGFVSNFIGFTNNPFLSKDRTISDDITFHLHENQLRECLYMSLGSWTHKFKKYLPPVLGRFRQAQQELDLPDIIRWHHRGEDIVYISSSPRGYWHGWEGRDEVTEWITKDLKELQEIRKHSSRRIFVRYHPSTSTQHREHHMKIMRNHIHDIEESPVSFLETIEYAWCCIANCSSIVMLMCLHGIPIVYRSDEFSTVPVSLIGLQGYENIENISLEELPQQEEFLDLMSTHVVFKREFQDGTFLKILNMLVTHVPQEC